MFYKRLNKGVTMIELLIALGIATIAASVVGYFTHFILTSGTYFTQTIKAQQEVQDLFRAITPEIRGMGPSALGGYPIASATSSSITFYSDIDKDGSFEQIRYFVSGAALKKGVIVPTGNPAVYNPASEAIGEMVHNMAATGTPVFSYYNSAYSGSEAPLNLPIDIPAVRVIKISILTQEAGQATPLSFGIELTPRNLRSNL
ncbi:prepilin-type N-terminal cleavage/methylation domain-containing protein [Candidatus Wolfebacteria bacterium]|nr:prepilin-type N-terminal cleavage/methylation domain-containing protein [Candidatus Wolfebacteria bacterium]